MNRLSACLITLNEEHNLPRALSSLKGIVDDVVVVDSGSTDRTAEIAREHGAAVFERAWTNYSVQKNFAAARAQNNWVLSLDADEELSTALQTSILDWKKHEPKFSVYEMTRKTWYLGAWIYFITP
jgi:glycosyltransferase involved in cell wall biosynthesis